MIARSRTESRLDTIVGPDTFVKGDVRVLGSVRFDGQVEGKVEAGGTFLSGPKSLLKGGLICQDAVIAGRVEGDISAQGMVELQTGAQVFGNIRCKGLVIQADCFFEGSCTMAQRTDAAG